MKRIISTTNAPSPIGPYNQAIYVNDVLYVSGQIALDAVSQQLIIDNISVETTKVMENISAILKEANMNFSNVVKSTIFITDMEFFAEVNLIYGNYFSENFPARETVAVKSLPKNVNVEISVIAVKIDN